MKTMKDEVTDEIISLITAENVVGLATHRHYPRERIIYSRFGRCGFAIDVVKMVDGVRKTFSVLVEAYVDTSSDKVEDFFKLPGKILYTLSSPSDGGRVLKRREAAYRDGEDLFSRVERVRRSFYSVYSRLKEKEKEAVTRIGEEIFHAVGLTADELHLGV